MNAAARLVQQGVLSRHLIFPFILAPRRVALLFLSFTIILSALSIVYVTHTARIMHSMYQHNLIEQAHLHVQQGQLLLERSTWMMQAKVQHIAEKKLGMVFPDHNSVVIVRE